MATDKEIDQIERRSELAVKVATLEERSLNNQDHMNKIEGILGQHATDEEQMLKDINTSLITFKSRLLTRTEFLLSSTPWLEFPGASVQLILTLKSSIEFIEIC